MSTLYEMRRDYLDVYNMDDVEEDVWFDTLESIEADIEVKADGYAKIIKEYEAEAEKFKIESKRLAERQRILENRVKRMKSILYETMVATKIDEIKNPIFKIKIKNNGGAAPLIIREGAEIPAEFLKVTVENDNDAIRKALKEGELDFAYLGERGRHLEIK